MSGEQYDEEYFLRGKQTGKSLYENYRWLPDLTIPMVASVVSHLYIGHDDTILDFGCARGYVVKAFRYLGYNARGIDISEWAIKNADEEVRQYLRCCKLPISLKGFDWVIAKDVLEHVPNVADIITILMAASRIGVFAVVPLGYGQDGYVVPEYEKDVTHIHRLSLATWVGHFLRPGWIVEAAYRVRGVKDNYAEYRDGNGFITARRIE